MWSTQLVSATFALLQLQSVQHAFSYIVLADRLFASRTVIVDRNEFVPSEVDLTTNQGGEVVIQAENWTRSHDGCTWEGSSYCFLSFCLGFVVKTRRILVGSSCTEMDEAMDAVLGTCLGYPLWHLDVDPLEIFYFFYFVSGTQ